MSFLDLYEGDQAQAAKIQPNEGTRLPSTFAENFGAAWSDGRLFGQSIARQNARAAVLSDYLDEIRQKTGQDLSKAFIPDVAGGGQTGVTDFGEANDRVARLKQDYPDLDLAPLSDEEIDRRAVAKAQSVHRDYEALQTREKGPGAGLGSFLGSAAASAADPVNILALAIAPETGGSVGILSSAIKWGALAGTSQAAIEAMSGGFKEQVQPSYAESGQAAGEVAGAFAGGAVLGGTFKALGSLWSRAKTGVWPTSVRDAGNIIESEAHVAETNPFPGVEGEVAHREALVKTIDDILAGRPIDVGQQITPELQKAAADAELAKAVPGEPSPMPTEQLELPLQAAAEEPAPSRAAKPELGPTPPLQTTEDMAKVLTEPAHQDAIRADIDRARAMGDVKVPHIDENGNPTMRSVDAAMDEVDAYKQAAEQIQACANPVQEAAE